MDPRAATVGRLLAEARRAAHLTQAEAAGRLRVSQSLIAKVESGVRRLSYLEAIELARIYGVPLEAFDPGQIERSRPAEDVKLL